MSKRAFILWGCLAILLFSAAQLTPPLSSAPGAVVLADGAEPDPAPDSSEYELLSAAYGPAQSTVDESAAPPPTIKESTLWLARAIYSETKLPHEQELVAWVVRNRVETGYRGSSSYKEAVLDPYQFSAFNPGAPKRSFLMSLTPEVHLPEWQQALWIAYYVQHADPLYRPFSIETRHFYSERSMKKRPHPYWANHRQFVTPVWDYQLQERRFRFYESIS